MTADSRPIKAAARKASRKLATASAGRLFSEREGAQFLKRKIRQLLRRTS